MKKILILPLWIAMLQLTASAQSLNTQGDFSPTVVAKNFTATYGVRSDAILAILDVYAKQGLPPQDRKARTEALIKDYKNAIPQVKGISQLSKDEQNSLGIAAEAGLVQALNWDMFARQYYLSTKGAYSPAIVAQGDVSIWYGIPEPALRTLAGRLEANAVELGEFGAQLEELAEKYNALKKEFETYGPGDPVVRQAEQLLEEGKLEEAEALLESDYRVSKKRLAYKAYLYGKTKELLLKYEEAAEGYEDAVALEGGNLVYMNAYGKNELNLARYQNVIEIFNTLLEGERFSSQLSDLKRSDLLTDIGLSQSELGNYEASILSHLRASRLDSLTFGMNHPEVATDLNNLGAASENLGRYQIAIAFYEEALKIDTNAFGMYHPTVATILGNLGKVFFDQKQFEKAIPYFEKALEIDTFYYAQNHPDIGLYFHNLGFAWGFLGKADMAIDYIKHGIEIDSAFWGNGHPKLAIHYRALGQFYYQKGGNDQALFFMSQALQIDTMNFGLNSPNVARDLNGIGCILCSKGQYGISLAYHDQALQIGEFVWGPKSTFVAISNRNSEIAANSWGNFLLQKGNRNHALWAFERALDHSESAGDVALMLRALKNIVSIQRHFGKYQAAIDAVDEAEELGDSLAIILFENEKHQADSTKDSFTFKVLGDSILFGPTLRTLRLHRIQCLQALGRHKEAKAAAKTLITDALAAKDEIVIADLRKDGWLKD